MNYHPGKGRLILRGKITNDGPVDFPPYGGGYAFILLGKTTPSIVPPLARPKIKNLYRLSGGGMDEEIEGT
jgi:hypothetical protein